MKLSKLAIGSTATIESVGGSGALRQHFLDMGLIQGTEVTVIKYAPMGDPIELRIHGYELTIRLDDAENIEVGVPHSPKAVSKKMRRQVNNHPGYGEGGKFHDRKNENPLPDSETLTFALVGNQNCGKTTLFNQLTGSKQHVGNFPGVTVDRKDGVIKGHENTLITDLPGIYSMSPYSNEEIVTREFVMKEKPKAIINIVDATNIERNLYLTMQLLELGFPMVVALNMMDELRENGGSVHVNDMEAALGVPVIPISASKGEGIEELISHAIHVAKYQETPLAGEGLYQALHDTKQPEVSQKKNLDRQENGIYRGVHAVTHLIEDHARKADIPVHFAASKVIEGDTKIIEQLALTKQEKEILEQIAEQMERDTGLDRAAAIAQMRFRYIEQVCSNAIVKPEESKERIRSQKIDKFLTGKYTGIPAFIGIMGIVFWLTFSVVGESLKNLLGMGIGVVTKWADTALQAAHVNTVVHSLVIDGVFTGVGGVLSFLPIIVTLFFFLSILEDSGYMARVAFIMDKLLRKLGLSGRSIVPMLIGFGCTVPGVMASRTLPSERDRKMTILLTPFMSCTAKLPIYAFFTAAFFPEHGGLVMISLYVLGIVLGILMALIFKKTTFKGEAVPFVMELPNYRMPGAKNVMHLLWDKAKDFLQRAFTVIFVAVIAIWFLQNFDMGLNMISDSQNSILAKAAGFIAPLFIPVGFGDWRIVTALVSGFMAKESVVSTLTVLFGSTAALQESLSVAGAASLLVFCLLYTPCAAAIASVKRELGGKWAIIMAVGQCVIAWLAAFVIYQLGMLF